MMTYSVDRTNSCGQDQGHDGMKPRCRSLAAKITSQTYWSYTNATAALLTSFNHRKQLNNYTVARITLAVNSIYPNTLLLTNAVKALRRILAHRDLSVCHTRASS